MTQKNKLSLGSLEALLGLTGENASFEKNRSLSLRQISQAESAQEGDLVFIAQESFMSGAMQTKASVLVVSQDLWAKIPAEVFSKKICVSVKDAMLAFAKVSSLFSLDPVPEKSIHPTALIHPTAKLGKNVSVCAYVVVGENAVIGDDSILHPHVSIGAGAKIGKSCVLFPSVALYPFVVLGDRVRIHASSVIGADGFGYVQERTPTGVKHVKIHHMGTVRIGDDVEIGASTCIDRGTIGDTVIGNGCIIDNQVQIGHNCQLDEGVIICGSSGIAGSVKIGRNSVLAGFVGVANKSEIGAGTIVSAFSMVFGKVPAGIKWGGVPARPMKEYFRLQALVGRLPELFEAHKLAKRAEKNKETENEL